MIQNATITTENLRKEYVNGNQILPVLRLINATFNQGTTYAIMGTSGSGKSTFMHLIGGLEEPTSGSVFFNQQNFSLMTAQERTDFLQLSIGFVFQSPYMIKELSVLENVMIRGLIRGMDISQCKLQAKELLHAMGLSDFVNAQPPVLSGGQQQRVALARALFGRPAFLLADEPTGGLDEATGKEIVQLLLSCQREWGMGVIVSTHDHYVAKNADTIIHLKDGCFDL